MNKKYEPRELTLKNDITREEIKFIEKIYYDNLQQRIDKALEIAFEYSQIDGSHHKAYSIDQMVRALTGDNYKQWVKEYEHDEETGEEYSWDTGIAP